MARSVAGVSKGANENIAEHSYWVTVVSLAIASVLIQQGKAVNIEKLLLSALMHDWQEAVCGDIPFPFKQANKDLEEHVRAIEGRGEESVWGIVPQVLSEFLKENDSNLLSENDIEKKILNGADRIAGVLFANDMIASGAVSFQAVIDRCAVAVEQELGLLGNEFVQSVTLGIKNG